MSDEEKHSESGFCYPDELEFQDNSDLTETNKEGVGERENEGNTAIFHKAVDIFLYVLTFL